MGIGRKRAKERVLPAANGRDDGDGGVGGEGSGQATDVADGFVAHKDVDVFADLAFLGDDAIAEAWIPRPQEFEGVPKRSGRARDLNFAVSFGKRP